MTSHSSDAAARLRGAVHAFAALPTVVSAAKAANLCGPIAFALAAQLRRAGHRAGAVRVLGYPPCIPGSAALHANPLLKEDGSGHYLVRSGTALFDLAFQQFDPGARRVVEFPFAAIGSCDEESPGFWWDEVDDELGEDEPLNPVWFSYGDLLASDVLAFARSCRRITAPCATPGPATAQA